MKIESLKSQIEQLQQIVDGWHDDKSIASLEMDMALDRVKRIYEILRFDGRTPSVIGGVAEVVSDVVVEAVSGAVDEVVDQIAGSAIEILEQIEAEGAEEVIEDAVEQMVDEQLDSVAQSYDKEPTQGEQPTPSDNILDKRERQNRIRSLYGASSTEPAQVAPTPQPAETPVAEVTPEAEVSEIEQAATPTPPPPANDRPAMSLQLTINDRFLLANDLFDNDMEALNAALAQLDAQSSFDDAIIYIAENYSWNSSSDGAKILITLLKRRFNIN